MTCEVVEDQQADRKFDSQAAEPTSTLNFRANTENESRSDSMDVPNNNPNISDYFRSSTNRGRQGSKQNNCTKYS